jgi:hypothetical protein
MLCRHELYKNAKCDQDRESWCQDSVLVTAEARFGFLSEISVKCPNMSDSSSFSTNELSLNVAKVENIDVKTQSWELPKLGLGFYLRSQSSVRTCLIADALAGMSYARMPNVTKIENCDVKTQSWELPKLGLDKSKSSVWTCQIAHCLARMAYP